MREAEIAKLYNASAHIYNARYREIQIKKYSSMLAGLKLRQPILDLGCGTGLLAEFLNKRIFGIDIAYKMAVQAKKEIVVVGDVCTLPFKNNSFNTILSFTVGQNVSNVKKFLSEILRIARPSALIVLTILYKFADKFIEEIQKNFFIQEIKNVDEDVGLILSPNK